MASKITFFDEVGGLIFKPNSEFQFEVHEGCSGNWGIVNSWVSSNGLRLPVAVGVDKGLITSWTGIGLSSNSGLGEKGLELILNFSMAAWLFS